MCLHSVDGTAFQGRVLHVIQAKKTPEIGDLLPPLHI